MMVRILALALLALASVATPALAAERVPKGLSCAAFGNEAGPEVLRIFKTVRAGDPYYVEFRQRSSRTVLPGHLYAVFGRLGGNGEPATRHFTGLEPGNTAEGPFPEGGGAVSPSARDCKRSVQLAFRVSLSAKLYSRLVARVKSAAAAPPRWRVFAYNCHDYVAHLAASVGLKSGGVTAVPSALYMRAFIAANGG